ncbi:CehA/McbA family metallohydrolase [Fundicoccus sp. Sow4_H7]|uniref:CehA/McbA family metallohydrolase n=1 Tax=Fundicoccus sp. Sow4_H7 TaxID=3438784 RepID=UPI003F8E51EE
MENIVFKIAKDQEGLYLPLEFQVEDIELLEIWYEYDRRVETVVDDTVYESENAIIDFSIIGPNGQFLGSSGSNRQYLFFSERKSSVGFDKLQTMKGTWTILVGAYKIPEAGIEVEYSFKTHPKKYRWYKGDLHMHTTASDGQLRTTTLVEVAKDMGLDFIVMTDHNNYHPEAGYLSDADLTVIPGVEWTQYNGHGNFINLDRPLAPSFATETDDALHAMIQKGKDAGALFVVNHPFCTNVPWNWTLDVDFDTIEIWNGGSDPRANARAIEWWHQELVKGRRIPAVGGSDFHRFDQLHSLGSPTTHIFSRSNSRTDVLAALKASAAYITNNVNGIELEMVSSDGVNLGGVTSSEETVSVILRHLKKGNRVKVIDDVETQVFDMAEDTKEWGLKEVMKDRKFLRLEVWDVGSLFTIQGLEGNLLLVSNPIYVRR